jgi:hypothetical protein
MELSYELDSTTSLPSGEYVHGIHWIAGCMDTIDRPEEIKERSKLILLGIKFQAIGYHYTE